MFKFNDFSLSPYYEEADGTGTGDDVKNPGREGLIELLEKDDEAETLELGKDKKSKEKDDKEEVEETDEEKDDEEDEEDELKELEDELDEPDESKLELVVPVRRKEILAKYPKLFKEFPYLEKAYYREQQFTEIVPTIEDAREAVANAGVLKQFESDLSKGNIETALKAVKGAGDNAFNTLVDNYLPTLARVDKDSYLHVVGNIIKSTTIQMLQEAKNSSNEELKEAAQILNHFVFGNSQITNPSNLSKPKAEGEKDPNTEIEEREYKFKMQQFETTRDGLNEKVEKTLKNTIEQNIDPKQSMTDYVRRNASRECQEKLETLLEGDKRLGILIDRLWEDAFKKNFSRESVDKIKSAYLSRARTLLPTVIKQARNEALKGLGKRVKEDKDEEQDDTPKNKGPLPAGRSSSGGGKKESQKTDKDRARDIPAGMSTREFLEQD